MKPSKPKPDNAARRTALRLLARREHSASELARKLASRGHTRDDIEAALQELRTEGLLDDRRCAEAIVRSQVDRGRGPVRIRRALEERGVSYELIREALDPHEHEWADLARAVRAKRFGIGSPADAKERGRQMRFLAYRGFTSEQIRQAIRSGSA